MASGLSGCHAASEGRGGPALTPNPCARRSATSTPAQRLRAMGPKQPTLESKSAAECRTDARRPGPVWDEASPDNPPTRITPPPAAKDRVEQERRVQGVGEVPALEDGVGPQAKAKTPGRHRVPQVRAGNCERV